MAETAWREFGRVDMVFNNAGIGIGMFDADYEKAGAKVLPSAEDVFATADMIVKVKEPQPVERAEVGGGIVHDGFLLY